MTSVVARRNASTWVYTPAEAERRGLELCGLCGAASLPWTLRALPDRSDIGRVCDECEHWLEQDALAASRRRPAKAR